MIKKEISEKRKIPSVEAFLKTPGYVKMSEKYGRNAVVYSVRAALDEIKKSEDLGSIDDMEKETLVRTRKRLCKIFDSRLREVINATGVVIHTNLGRSPLGEDIVREMSSVLKGYCDLEFDLSRGERGKRTECVEEALKFLTGAEAVAVVNNNAAALMLVLSVFARKKEVVVSRGELVEIGGSFRIPEILSASGAKMVEVGTTNRTRISDYSQAISPRTAMLLKVHKSNYVIKGFTEEVPLGKLTELSKKKQIPLLFDLGSGCVNNRIHGIFSQEPDVKSAVLSGADFVCFSGDKLFGGPQAGIICGRKENIDRLKKAPMMRALRVGKLTLSALGSVAVRHAEASSVPEDIPVLRMMSSDAEDIKAKASKLADLIVKRGLKARIEKSAGKSGGGSLADLDIESYCAIVEFSDKKDKKKAQRIYNGLMTMKRPIVAVLRKGELVFDVLTVEEKDLNYIADSTVSMYETLQEI